MHAPELQLFDQRDGISKAIVDNDASVERHFAASLSAMVPRNATIAIAKRRDLRVKHARTPEQSVRKEEWWLVAAGILDPQFETIDKQMHECSVAFDFGCTITAMTMSNPEILVVPMAVCYHLAACRVTSP